MNSTAQWVRATKSAFTPYAPDQRRSPASELSPMASLCRVHLVSQQGSDAKNPYRVFNQVLQTLAAAVSLIPFAPFLGVIAGE